MSSSKSPLPGGRRDLKSESGSILILTALAMVLLLGIAAFAVDASFMYTERNRMHAAADDAAKSAAWEIFRAEGADLQAFANREALTHGFNAGDAGTDVILTVPPDARSRFAGQTGYAQVEVRRLTNTFFATILGWANLRPAAWAVAGQSSGPYCLITLGDSPAGVSVGRSTLNMPNCAIADAGDLVSTQNGGQAYIISNGTSVADDACQGNCTNMGVVAYNSPKPVDPLEDKIAAPSYSGPCGAVPTTDPIPTNNTCYGAFNVVGARTFAPGTVYFNGPITFNNHASLTGNGVTLVLDNGSSITAANNNEVTLVAPTSGTYRGVALLQPASNTNPITFQNSSSFNITGAMYAPTADVYFRNGLDTSSDCVLFVIKSLTIDNGNGAFNNACSAYAGSPLMSVSLAE